MNILNSRWTPPLAMGLVLCAGLPASSEESAAEGEPFSLQICVSESDDDRRLQCFDRWAAKLMRDGSVYVPVVGMRMTKAMLEDEFGMRGEVLRNAREKRQREQPRIDRLDAHVVNVDASPTGQLLIELSNGQAWEQTQGKVALFLKEGDSVYLTRGTLGSFFLTTEQRRAIRVRRLR
jgi:hypothetical protein